MIHSLRKRLSYSNVIASIALFIALGGAAVAAGLPRNSVGPQQLKRGAVTTKALARNAVTSAKLARGAVGPGKLGPNSVGPGNIGNGAITSAKIGGGAVIAASIKNGVVTTNKLQNNAVNSAKLDSNAVGTNNIANGAVTPAKLSNEFGPVLGALRSGQTLRGVIALGGSSTGTGVAFDSVSYQFPISGNAPGVTVLKKGAPATANCAGIGSGSAPSATAGNLCIYLTEEENLSTTIPVEVVNNQRLGFGIKAVAEAAGAFSAYGQWAVTAP